MAKKVKLAISTRLGEEEAVSKKRKRKRKEEPIDSTLLAGEEEIGEKRTKKKNEKKGCKQEDGGEAKSDYLPGQKHGTPHERDPLRIFLEVLYQRNPEDEMAALWMMEFGLLSPEEAKKVLRKDGGEEEAKDPRLIGNIDCSQKNHTDSNNIKLEKVSKSIEKTKKRKTDNGDRDDTKGLKSLKKRRTKDSRKAD